MYLAACTLFLAVPLWAQHGGGGHGGGGGHAGGGFGGHAGFSGGGSRFSGGMRSGGMRSGAIHSSPIHSSPIHASSGVARGFSRGPVFAQRNSSRGPFLHDGFRGNRSRHGFGRNGFGNRFRSRGFGNNCYGYGCWGGYGYGYPWWGDYDFLGWGDSDSSYDQDYQDNLAQADQMNQESLQEQQEEQQMRRQEEADGDQDICYARPAQPPREESLPQPATVLVFRDQHKQEVHNYAIVGQTLWSFGARTEKIPLADLDLAATVKANDERGLTFHVPVGAEGQ